MNKAFLTPLCLSRCAQRSLPSLRDTVGSIDPSSLYEPKFTDPREFPEYPSLNVRLQGPDYAPLEKYQSYVHTIAKRFKFPVMESYAVAAQTQKAVMYKPLSTIVEAEMDLATYDRVVRIGPVPAPRLQLFVQMIEAHAPIGVTITVKEHEKSDEDYRYIPDILLKQKQDELRALDDPNVRRNLGWE